MSYRVLDLFSAAAGGWSLGMHRAGFTTMAACEFVDWRRALYQENNPNVRIYDDVRTLTADRILRDCGFLPDYVVGSPPCQDISSANTKGKGIEGDRSGLYFEAIRIIGETRPRGFALENSANLRTRGADAVLAALEAIGYSVWPFVVGAGDVGANHERARSWLIGFDLDQVANAGSWQQWEQSGRRDGPNWTSPSFDGYDDKAEHSSHAHGYGWDGWRRGRRGGFDVSVSNDLRHPDRQPSAARLGPPENEGQDAFSGGRLRQISNTRGDGAFLQSGNLTHADQAGCWSGKGGVECMEAPSGTSAGGAYASGDARIGDGDSGRELGQMGGSEDASLDTPEPWSDWNGGLTGHLRVDDGISAWVAGTRIAVGGPKGTSAASLIVEAFGDAVVPQIPEAIGRAILRTEAALRAIYARPAA